MYSMSKGTDTSQICTSAKAATWTLMAWITCARITQAHTCARITCGLLLQSKWMPSPCLSSKNARSISKPRAYSWAICSMESRLGVPQPHPHQFVPGLPIVEVGMQDHEGGLLA